MPRLIDLSGQRFGRLTVMKRIPNAGGDVKWLCKCDCGGSKITATQNLRSGDTNSCGCIKSEAISQRNFKHGKAYSREFRSWAGMINRCKNASQKSFARYGGRGISVCHRWQTFANFYEDMGDRPEGTTLDRIDNNRGYEPGNCRWATVAAQNQNRRSNRIIEFEGVRLCLAEWERRVGIDRETIRRRLESGWSVEQALTVKTYGRYGRKVRLTPAGASQ